MPIKVYADHAATTPLCNAAWEAMVPFLRGEFGNPSSLHSWAKVPRKAIAEARATIAECIGANLEEIYFTSGGTESDNWVLKGTTGGLMVSTYEHHAVLNAAASEADRGREVVIVSPNSDGVIKPGALARKWKGGIGLVSVMMANNEIGTINPINLLAEAAHERGALFHTDAVQAVGHIPIDVHKLGVDFLSASAHKFNGPKGIGFLYVRNGLKLNQLINGGQQEAGMRAGTENVASIVGMAAALKENCRKMSINSERLYAHAKRFRDGIRSFCANAIFHTREEDNLLPGFVSVAFPGYSAEGLMHILDIKGIAVSTGAACDSKNTKISHVLKSLKIPASLAKSTIRVTFGPENAIADVIAIVTALESLLGNRNVKIAK